MVKFEQSFRSAVASLKREVLIDQIRSNPAMTVSELGKLATGDLGPMLKNVTIGDIIGGAGAGGRKGKGRKGRADAGDASAEVNTRTQKGREAYDTAMLAALKGGSGAMSAPDLAKQVGGTPLQVRTSLNRLIGAGHVTYTGKARGTRYQAS